MNKILKWTITIPLGVALGFGVTAALEPEPEKPKAVLTVQELIHRFDENEVRAVNQLVGNPATITGEFKSVGKTVFGNNMVKLTGKWPNELTAKGLSDAEVMTLTRGQTVTVDCGAVDFGMIWVSLLDCELVQP